MRFSWLVAFGIAITIWFIANIAGAGYTYDIVTLDQLYALKGYDANADFDTDKDRVAFKLREQLQIEGALNSRDVNGWELFDVDGELYIFRKVRP